MSRKKTDDFTLDLIKSLNKEHGAQVAYNLAYDTSPTHVNRWISTGSRLLDYICSNRPKGGLPEGRIIEIFGPPSTISTFDNDVWIYIERKITKSSLLKFGKKKLLVNNVSILELNSKGLLVKKDFFDKEKMNKINFSKNETQVLNKKDSFIYNVLSSIRHKINDPLGKRKPLE